MDLLKKIPITYLGELHDVRLLNFSVDIDEIRNHVPAGIRIRDFGGRALFSMVDVKLKNMRPAFLPSCFHFEYRHIAFRLLVADGDGSHGQHKGIFFHRSFTDKPLIVAGGKYLTDYNLEMARIEERGREVILSRGEDHLSYELEDVACPAKEGSELQINIQALDRAYSMLGPVLRVTQIQREKWPISPVECTRFENTFFSSSRLEGAFRVFETIYYRWLPPKPVRL